MRRRRIAFNTLAAMAVSGLWHGADWHFVAWAPITARGSRAALVQGGRGPPEVAPRLAGECRREPPAARAGLGLSVFLTFNFVAFGWVLFVLPVGQALAVWRLVASGIAHTAIRVLQHPGAILLVLKGCA